MSKLKIIGHRGARGLAPENTIASFKKALEYRVDVIEFDLRVTKDNIVIVHHDHKLLDDSANKLRIREHNFKELKAHKDDLITGEEAMKFLGKKLPLFIEVKQNEPVAPIVFLINKNIAAGRAISSLTVGSKSKKTLRELHRQMPAIKKGVIERWSGVRAVIRAKQVETNIIVMNQRWLWSGFISSMSRRGYDLYPYPLNDVKKAGKWAKAGMAGVITDFPDRFAKR